MSALDIGVLAQRSGVSTSTLRYYETMGLIQPCARRGLRRQYAPQTLTQLALISMGKAAGFSLAEIKDMFGSDGKPDLPRPALHAQADTLDRQIRRMRALSKALRHVADCPAPNQLQCERFLRLLRVSQPQ